MGCTLSRSQGVYYRCVPNVISYNAAISACVLSAVLPDVIPKLPPSVLERWEGKGSRPWVYGAVMQQPLLCPMSFPTMLPSVLVFCLLFCQMSFLRCRLQCWRDGPARAAGLGSWGGDAAAAVVPNIISYKCCHQCLCSVCSSARCQSYVAALSACEGPARAAGLGSMGRWCSSRCCAQCHFLQCCHQCLCSAKHDFLRCRHQCL